MTPSDWLAHLFGNCDGGWLSFLSINRTTGEKRTDWQRLDDPIGDLDLPVDTSCVWFGVATRSEQLTGNQRGRAGTARKIAELHQRTLFRQLEQRRIDRERQAKYRAKEPA